MIKALQISTAICNVQGAPTLIVMVVGDDGYVYQLISGKWERLPALDSGVIQNAPLPLHQTKLTQ